MAQNKKQEDEVLLDVGQSVSNAEKFIHENQKSLMVILVAFVVLVGGYFAYQNLYQQPREQEAKEAIYHAQMYFEQDSLRLAVNGDGQNMGFLDVADEYAGTKAGNLANYYAGISYLNMGQYDNAIALLDEFDGDDAVFSVIAKGSIGDAFWELNQPEEALGYYEKAVSGEDNNFVVPFYLKKAGMVAEELGKYSKAEKYYSRIKSDFPDSREGSDIEKFIARAEVGANK